MRPVLAERAFPVDELRLLRLGPLGRPHAAVGGRRGRGRGRRHRRLRRPRHRPVLRRRKPPRRRWRPASPPPAPSSSTTPRRGAWTPTCPSWSPRSTPHALGHIPKGIVANPNCTTMVAMPVLKPLHREAGLAGMIVSAPTRRSRARAWPASPSSPSRSARSGDDAAALAYDGVRRRASRARRSSPQPIAYNVIPLAGSFVDDGLGETDEEHKLRNESRKILGIPDLAVSGTCVRVPVFTGHSLAINAALRPAHHARAGPPSCSPRPPGVELVDVPTPLQGRRAPTRRYVGRIRARPDASSTASPCSSPATTSARAPPSTPCRSPRSCSAAATPERRRHRDRQGRPASAEARKSSNASLNAAACSKYGEWPASAIST